MTATPKMKEAPKVIRSEKDRNNDELLKFMKEECRPVKGIFKNYECPGGSLPLTMGKYPNQPIFNKTLNDGEEYEVPLWVARALNGIDVTAKERNGKVGFCSYPIHAYTIDKNTGQSIPSIGSFRQRYGFQSLDFVG